MKIYLVNDKENYVCRVFKGEEDCEKNNSMCFFKNFKDEILFEIIESKADKLQLLGFRIYKKETIKSIEKMIKLLKANNGYWSEEMDAKYPYVAD